MEATQSADASSARARSGAEEAGEVLRIGRGDRVRIAWVTGGDGIRGGEERERITGGDRVGGIADVRLVRGEKMNALDDAMFDALIEAGEALRTLPGLRGVVLSGQGKAFCAGLDMGRFQAMAGQPGASHALRLMPREFGTANKPQHAVVVWRRVPVPVIAAVHGVAFGGGFQLMLGADLRVLAPDARLSIMEVKWGLVPDMGGLALLRHLMPGDRVRELTYTARVFTGTEALALGLATRIANDPHAEALALAKLVAAQSPDAVRAAKRLFLEAEDGADEAQMLLAESREQSALLGSPNQVEAVRAGLERRVPSWREPAL